MDAVLIQSALFKLGFAFAAIALLFGALRALDRTLGISFSDVMSELRQGDGIPVALYFGLRILAVAVLIGLAIG